MTDDKCVRRMDCISPLHKDECPQNPANVQRIVVSADEWDRIQQELLEPPRDLPELREMMQRRTILWEWEDEGK